MREVDEHAEAVHLADHDAASGCEATTVVWGRDCLAGGVGGDEGCVGKGVVAVPCQGCGADAEGMVQAERGHWGRLRDLVESFDADWGDKRFVGVEHLESVSWGGRCGREGVRIAILKAAYQIDLRQGGRDGFAVGRVAEVVAGVLGTRNECAPESASDLSRSQARKVNIHLHLSILKAFLELLGMQFVLVGEPEEDRQIVVSVNQRGVFQYPRHSLFDRPCRLARVRAWFVSWEVGFLARFAAWTEKGEDEPEENDHGEDAAYRAQG